MERAIARTRFYQKPSLEHRFPKVIRRHPLRQHFRGSHFNAIRKRLRYGGGRHSALGVARDANDRQGATRDFDDGGRVDLSKTECVGERFGFLFRYDEMDLNFVLEKERLLEITVCKDKRLMVDEIDTGIHYSKMKEFWKIILLASKENNVQLFATTHSKECLQDYVEALKELQLESDYHPQ